MVTPAFPTKAFSTTDIFSKATRALSLVVAHVDPEVATVKAFLGFASSAASMDTNFIFFASSAEVIFDVSRVFPSSMITVARNPETRIFLTPSCFPTIELTVLWPPQPPPLAVTIETLTFSSANKEPSARPLTSMMVENNFIGFLG